MATPPPLIHGRYRLRFQAAGRGGHAFLVDRETLVAPDHRADGLIGTIRRRPDPADHRRSLWSVTLIDTWTCPSSTLSPLKSRRRSRRSPEHGGAHRRLRARCRMRSTCVAALSSSASIWTGRTRIGQRHDSQGEQHRSAEEGQ
jgi:hypothetical protein